MGSESPLTAGEQSRAVSRWLVKNRATSTRTQDGSGYGYGSGYGSGSRSRFGPGHLQQVLSRDTDLRAPAFSLFQVSREGEVVCLVFFLCDIFGISS